MRSLRYKIAETENEFEQIFRLNYKTFVEEIPQGDTNLEKRLVDKFHAENTYAICLDGEELVGMVAGRATRPFSLDAKIDAPDGGTFVLGVSYHAGWTASLNGRDLGRPVTADGVTAWILPKGASGRLEARFGPQRSYAILLAVTAVTVAVCLLLVVRRRRKT